jgi:ribosomal protein S18 acetylase RimI-like enzyme
LAVVYTTDVGEVAAADLEGFFGDWPVPPTPARRLEVLRGSDHVVLAREGERGRVVGFVTAISDGVLSAFIPLLEVLPDQRGRGIGSELVRRMLAELEAFAMVDLVCDPELVPFYRRFELMLLSGMSLRRPHLLRPEDAYEERWAR